MKVISVIEEEEVIKKILKHLGLDQRAKPPPNRNAPAISQEQYIDYTDSQETVSDEWLYADPKYPETFPT
jgi:hypothetical protein